MYMHHCLSYLSLVVTVDPFLSLSLTQPFWLSERLPTSLPPDDTVNPGLVKTLFYGLKSPLPFKVDKELKGLNSWASSPFQLNRSGSYARGVDSGTLDRERTQILGYLGFCYHQFNLPPSSLGLSLFERPDYILSLFTFLKVRFKVLDTLPSLEPSLILSFSHLCS